MRILFGITVVLGHLAVAQAMETPISITDYSGRGFAPDLVQYRLNGALARQAKLAVRNGEGITAPVQVEKDEGGKAGTLSFVAEVAPNQTAHYTLMEADGVSPQSRLTVKESRTGIEIGNGLLAIRLPAAQERTFKDGVAAATLPAPVLAFKSGASDWLGESRILTDRKVKAFRVALTAQGAVYTDVLYEIQWLEGGFYRAHLRVIDRVPVIKIREEFDLGALDGSDFWELQLVKGWKPDTMETARTYANGGGVDKGSNKPLSKLADMENPRISPDNISFSLSYIGVFNATDAAASETAPMAGFVPLHKGAWRKMNVVPVHSEGTDDVRLQLSMSARDANWQDDTTSETSPFSMGEHDPSLSRTYGRRIWGLALGRPAVRDAKKSTVRFTYFRAPQALDKLGPFAQTRSFYGTVGLNRYKDYVLDWPAGKTEYPLLYPAAQAGTTPPAWEGREFDNFMKELRGLCNAPISCSTISHHLTVGTYVTAAHAEALLGRDDLPANLRAEIRSRLALIMYLFEEPDFISYGNGAHTGNPNMGTSRYSGCMAFLPLLKDHPMFSAWRDHVSNYAEYKMASQIAPAGAYTEFGATYHMHGYSRTTSSLPGLLAAGAENAQRLYRDYHRPDWDYFMNLLTPIDPRFGCRVTPGLANSCPGLVGHFMEAAGSVAVNDPAFAANLRWAWEANGSAKVENPWIVPTALKPIEPALTSRIYPGFGVIFRAHQGPDETYMLLRSGFDWSHWYIDQGHMVVMSRQSVILPYQSYAYWSAEGLKEKKADFDYHNILRFGAPENEFPYGWPDGNVLNHAFGQSVDYAWVSTGIPDWFINPSINPALKGKLPPAAVTGMMRKLDGAFDQTEGAFDWNRQILFLKGKTATSPNYFVIRDSMQGDGELASYSFLNLLGVKDHIDIKRNRIHLDTDWPVKADLIFADAKKLKPAVYEENQLLTLHHVKTREGTPVRDWTTSETAKGKRGKRWEQRTMLRLANTPGEGRTWIVYPRKADEAAPTVKSLEPGVLRIQHPEGVDTAFLSTSPLHYDKDGILFEGNSGCVRVTPEGVTLALTEGNGRIGYRGTIYEATAPFEKTIPMNTLAKRTTKQPTPTVSITLPTTPAGGTERIPGLREITTEAGRIFVANTPQPLTFHDEGVIVEARKAMIEESGETVRFVTTDTTYVKLVAGTRGVRGVGPFDLTFSKTGISGSVDGTTRTLVTTWPEAITKPMFLMDGRRYYAGWADDHCIGKQWPTPQFSVAFGVLTGRHDVQITEWIYPDMPTAPERRGLAWK